MEKPWNPRSSVCFLYIVEWGEGAGLLHTSEQGGGVVAYREKKRQDQLIFVVAVSGGEQCSGPKHEGGKKQCWMLSVHCHLEQRKALLLLLES